MRRDTGLHLKHLAFRVYQNKEDTRFNLLCWFSYFRECLWVATVRCTVGLMDLWSDLFWSFLYTVVSNNIRGSFRKWKQVHIQMHKFSGIWICQIIPSVSCQVLNSNCSCTKICQKWTVVYMAVFIALMLDVQTWSICLQSPVFLWISFWRKDYMSLV